MLGGLPVIRAGRVGGTTAPFTDPVRPLNRNDRSPLPPAPEAPAPSFEVEHLRCYLPPRSNGLIGGRSFMIAHNLEAVSGSRLPCPAVVIK